MWVRDVKSLIRSFFEPASRTAPNYYIAAQNSGAVFTRRFISEFVVEFNWIAARQGHRRALHLLVHSGSQLSSAFFVLPCHGERRRQLWNWKSAYTEEDLFGAVFDTELTTRESHRAR